MCGVQSQESVCGVGPPSQAGLNGSGWLSGQLSLARSLVNWLGTVAGQGKPLAAACALALVAGSAGSAYAQGVDYGTPAAYTYGVTVATVFAVMIPILSGVLLPMIVASMCLAVVYFIWSFARGKASGNA